MEGLELSLSLSHVKNVKFQYLQKYPLMPNSVNLGQPQLRDMGLRV